MKIRHVEFKDGAIYDHAVSRALIRRLRAAADEVDGPDVVGLPALLIEAAIWISIMTDNFHGGRECHFDRDAISLSTLD